MAFKAVTLYVGSLNFGSLSICYAASTAHIATQELEALSSYFKVTGKLQDVTLTRDRGGLGV